MSSAQGKVGQSLRQPLQENRHLNKAMTDRSNSKIMETPVSAKGENPRISTPPESTMTGNRKRMIFDTPISKNIESEVHHLSSKAALLSPAFSSPQQKNTINEIPPPKPSFISSSSGFSSEDENVPKPSRKKTKKSKRAIKEKSFDFDSNDKPPYSYATLIGMSILSNQEKKLTLSQIYLWISDTFKYYKRDEVGWQNSIRHNLSLNKAFIKGEKSKDGKGHFWCIKTGCEEQFLKTRSNKKHSYQELMDQIYSVKSEKRSINSLPSSPNGSNDYDLDNEVYKHYEKKRRSSEIERAADYDKDEGYNTDEDRYNELTHPLLEPPIKKHKLFDPNESPSDTATNLGAPFAHNNITSKLTASPANAPFSIITESTDKPLLAGRNLTYSSSFSCSSNLELSPIRPSETGPLLEPLTPANNIYNIQQSQNTHSQRSILSAHLNHTINHLHHHHPAAATTHIIQKTPKSNILRTPLKNSRTPQTSSIMKKLWNSPSYLDDFYYSPLIGSSATLLNSYDDDDMMLRNLEHHQQLPNTVAKKHQVFSSRNLIHDFKRIDDSTSDKEADQTREINSSSTDVDE
ncbi:uncharacterized protein PRCAT00002868001 [Priceomyces carsonii]|uniref:uncharacterized protein n=1 Tax=Priceomyces carsonii TaxID=28549 RepID=UPI002ED799AA|nr:unnamed protein product [Priceomyces carsonii]